MLEHGLEAALDRLTSKAVRRNLRENRGRRVKTLAALKISTRRLYSVLGKQVGATAEVQPKVD